MECACAEQWSNWLGNQNCQFDRIVEPRSVEELRQCICQGANDGYRIKTMGAGFSLSEISCTDGLFISTKHLNRILSIDHDKRLVRVEAGIMLQELNEQLAVHHLALSNLPAISCITLGGALSTAVHGTGHTGSLASFIKSIELITADGTMHHLSLESDPEAFSAAKVSLGALGVIYAVTLQCEPLFQLKLDREEIDLTEIMHSYKHLYLANDFFQFAVDFETGTATTMRWNRSEEEDAPFSYETLPFYTPDQNDKDLFSEIAVAIDALPSAIRIVKKLQRKYSKYGVKIDANIRFATPDENCLLSPAADRMTAYLHLNISGGDHALPLFRELEDQLLPLKGRPHWGKINFLDYDKALKVYGSNFEKFIAVKQRLDPHGVFTNEYINRLSRF